MTHPTWNGPGPALVAEQHPPRRRGPRFRWAVLVAVLLLAACGYGVVTMATAFTTAAEVGNAPTMVAPATSGSVAKAKARTSVGPGMWKVGVDVAAGEWHTAGAVKSIVTLCYWDTRTTTGADTIVDQGVANAVDQPGVVTLKKGQYFKTSGCQQWTRS